MNLLDYFILINYLFNYLPYTGYRYFQLYDIVCFKSINNLLLYFFYNFFTDFPQCEPQLVF